MKITPCKRFVFLVAVLIGTVTSALAQPTLSPGGHFKFYEDPWISLHHFAYHWIRNEQRDRGLRGRVLITDSDMQAISNDMRDACASLHQAYLPYIEGNIRSDVDTRGITESLIAGVAKLPDTALRDALTECMPAYRTTLWPRHREANEKLVSHLMSLLERHEERVAQRLVELLEGSWPGEPIRVDVTPYANWAGAYTVSEPANITMSSYDEEVSGAYAFELLFHEASHTTSFENSIIDATDLALSEAGLESNRYWHYVLFYATGRIAEEVFSNEGYVPYIEATGLAQSASAAPYYVALDETWSSGASLQDRVLRAVRYMVAANPVR